MKELVKHSLLNTIQSVNSSTIPPQAKLIELSTQIHRVFTVHCQYIKIIDRQVLHRSISLGLALAKHFGRVSGKTITKNRLPPELITSGPAHVFQALP